MTTDRLDLAGLRFGRLTVLDLGPSDGGRRKWRCRCDCGAECFLPAGNLRSGNTKSCGCLAADCGKVADLVGARFGALVVVGLDRQVRRTDGKGIRTFWRCLCDCGRETVAQRSNLGKNKNSCGCGGGRDKAVEFSGVKMSVRAWARELSIPSGTIFNRLKAGWPLEHALFLPVWNRSGESAPPLRKAPK